MNRRGAFIVLTLVLVLGNTATSVASKATAEALSRQAIPPTEAWRAYVLDDPDGVVYPETVTVNGDPTAVTQPDALTAADGVGTTIRSSGEPSAPTPTLTVDLGLNTGGFVEVGVLASDGTPFRIGYSEHRPFLKPTGDITPRPGGLSSTFSIDDDPDHRNDVFTPTASSSRQQFTSPAVRGGQRYLHLQVEGTGRVTLDYVRVRVTHLSPDYAGWFHSSDADLNRIWFASAYTVNLATIRDVARGTPYVYVDGAKRDRLIWNYDAIGAELSGYYASARGAEIARNTLTALSCQQHPNGLIPPASQISITCEEGNPGPPDGPPPGSPPYDVLYTGNLVQVPAYTAAWVAGLYEYWLHTGHDAFVTPLLPVARRAMRFFDERLVGGLFPSQTQGPEITWHIDPAAGFDTYTNMTYYRTLKNLAALERHLGDDVRAARYEADAAALRQAIFTRLWDPLVGAFLVNDVDPLRNHTSDVNLLAVSLGLVTGTKADALLDFVRRTHHTPFGTALSERPEADAMVSQFNATYVMAPEIGTRFAHDDTAGALRTLRTGYVHMLETGPGTMWERIGPNGGPWMKGPESDGSQFTTNTFMSFAHPMASAVPSMSAWIVGIRPATPGYDTWVVTPKPGDLRFAQGQAPTPHGPLASRWERGADGSSFHLTVDAPKGTTGSVHVPLLGANRVIAVDGHVVWDGTRAVGKYGAARVGDAVEIRGVAGTHTFAWTR